MTFTHTHHLDGPLASWALAGVDDFRSVTARLLVASCRRSW